MNNDDSDLVLENHRRDYVASAARAALGAVPFVGSLLAEIAGTVIPNQRIDRVVKFAHELELRLGSVEHELVRSQLTDENFTDLMEEGLRQAARSLSDERRAYIAALIARSVASTDISYVESKHLLRLLGELNDIEVIRLVSHKYETFGSGEEYWQKHKGVLEPVNAHMNASQEVFDKATLQNSYDEHLARLGLLRPRFAIDHRTKQPEFDSWTGAQKRQGYQLSSLGWLLIREIGVEIEDAG